MSDTEFTQAAGKWTIDRDPNAVLDYKVDFTLWLDAMSDTLASHTTTPTDVVVDSSSIVGKSVVLWISGGTVGTPGSVKIHVVTTGGRSDDRTIYFKIKER